LVAIAAIVLHGIKESEQFLKVNIHVKFGRNWLSGL
jgi:hypothetical protein